MKRALAFVKVFVIMILVMVMLLVLGDKMNVDVKEYFRFFRTDDYVSQYI